MSFQRKCVICGEWFPACRKDQSTCDSGCRKEFVRQYKKKWQKGGAYQEYQKRYRKEHAQELSCKAVIRVREWRKKNKRKYLIQSNGDKCSGKWVEVMAYYEWTCGECNKEAQLVHHIDRDTTNNSKRNLVALCRACHCKIHKPHEFHKN